MRLTFRQQRKKGKQWYAFGDEKIPDDLIASASDNDGSIVTVDFFEDVHFLGRAFEAPYTFTWTNVSVGDYTLRAVATDNSGLTSTSIVSVTVVTSLPIALLRGPYEQFV